MNRNWLRSQNRSRLRSQNRSRLRSQNRKRLRSQSKKRRPRMRYLLSKNLRSRSLRKRKLDGQLKREKARKDRDTDLLQAYSSR